MRNSYLPILILAVSLPTLLLANAPALGNTTPQPKMLLQQQLTARILETINTDGDLSLSPEQNKIQWNPHAVGLTKVSTWKITFNNETEMQLETTPAETGHIATGAWWTTSFKTRAKFPLCTSEPVDIAASFRINIIKTDLNTGNEWLRIALASAVQRTDGSVVYTEIDLWDSPTSLAHPSGNTQLGGNVIYRGGDVVEYKVDQVATGQWKSYALNLTHYINSAWQIRSGDLLESVYFVVEAAGAVNITVRTDDLLIVRLD